MSSVEAGKLSLNAEVNCAVDPVTVAGVNPDSTATPLLFEQALANQSVPWKPLRGSHEERLLDATNQVRQLFQYSAWQPRVRFEK
jgi:hypothetical protein